MLLQHLGANVSYPFVTAKRQNFFLRISMEYFYSFVKIDSFLIIGFSQRLTLILPVALARGDLWPFQVTHPFYTRRNWRVQAERDQR
jgi:hypothetical protein